jgi:hypothetical protein
MIIIIYVKNVKNYFLLINIKKMNCDSNVFKFINKVRLLTMALFIIINIDYLEQMIEKMKVMKKKNKILILKVL